MSKDSTFIPESGETLPPSIKPAWKSSFEPVDVELAKAKLDALVPSDSSTREQVIVLLRPNILASHHRGSSLDQIRDNIRELGIRLSRAELLRVIAEDFDPATFARSATPARMPRKATPNAPNSDVDVDLTACDHAGDVEFVALALEENCLDNDTLSAEIAERPPEDVQGSGHEHIQTILDSEDVTAKHCRVADEGTD